MRVAIIVPSKLPVPAVHGGAIETLIQNFIDENELQKRLFCDVFTVFDSKAEFESKKYRYTNFIWIKKNIKDTFSWYYYRGINFFKRKLKLEVIGMTYESLIIRKKIKKYKYDAVIVEGNGDYLHFLKDIVSKKNLFFHIHSFHHCEINGRNEYLMKLPSKIISVSNFISGCLINNLNINQKNLIVVKNCISNHFYNKELTYKKKIKEETVSLVYTGRIVKEKGILELLDALILIKNLNWKLNIIGSFGSDFGLNSELNKTITSKFEQEVMKKISLLSDKVIFLGYVTNNDIPVLYKNFDLAIVPSICNDAAPLIVGEFMASGIAVIASNKGGIPEYLSETAGLVKFDDNFVENLATKIKTLIENEDLRNKFVEKGLELSHNYKPKKYYNEIIQKISQ